MPSARMGEMVVSDTPGDELVALGLGSCIGVVMIDRLSGVAGLAHIVLPESAEHVGQPGKFADTAIPELIAQITRAGGRRGRLRVAMAGGASMFGRSHGLDIGARNTTAVSAALAAALLHLEATETGGVHGRTLRVDVGAGEAVVRIAGREPIVLLAGGTITGRATRRAA